MTDVGPRRSAVWGVAAPATEAVLQREISRWNLFDRRSITEAILPRQLMVRAMTLKPDIRLGRLELRIMHVVWDRGRATVHEVLADLGGSPPPAYSTILTMMRKLEAKGYLRHEVQDRTYVYSPTLSRQDVRRALLMDILDRLFDGSPALLFESLLDQERIGPGVVAKIETLLRKRKKK